MRYTCSVQSCGVAVSFLSNLDLYDRFNILAKETYIPDMIVQPRGVEGQPVLVYINKTEGNYLHFTDTRVEVGYPWEMMRVGETILYLSYPLMELQRQMQCDLTAHAACVSLDGEGILLLGKEGSGKTSAAIDLCRKYGARLIANDLCVLGCRGGSVIARGGTKFFFLRRESVKRNLPDLLQFFASIPPTDPWLDKVKISHERIGVQCEDAEIRIRSAFLLHVDETKARTIHMSADGIATRLYLNENFSRYIRSSCTVMIGGNDSDYLGYIPSLDQEEFFSMRRRLMLSVTRGCNLEYVSGPLEGVLDYVVSSHLERATMFYKATE